jgi:hypothetical protein
LGVVDQELGLLFLQIDATGIFYCELKGHCIPGVPKTLENMPHYISDECAAMNPQVNDEGSHSSNDCNCALTVTDYNLSTFCKSFVGSKYQVIRSG